MRVGKRQLFMGSMILAGIFNMALFVIPTHATVMIIGVEVLRQFSFGLSGPILWAMMGDVADYGEWKTGRRASGTVTAAVVFALWAGSRAGRSHRRLAVLVLWFRVGCPGADGASAVRHSADREHLCRAGLSRCGSVHVLLSGQSRREPQDCR